MGQGVRAAGRSAEEGDASSAGEPAGGAAKGPAAVRARTEGRLPAAGTVISGGGPDVPATTALRQHRRLGVKGALQSALGGGQRTDGLAGRGRDVVQGTLGELRPLP
jgi:hypothetical protein